MITPNDIKSAFMQIGPKIRRTPTLQLAAGQLCDSAAVSLKLELFQSTGSFKFRGAMNALMSQHVPAAGVAAFSGGNHGAALAHAATSLGVPCKIFTSLHSGSTKIGRMQGFGAEVIVSESAVPRILDECADYARTSGALLVHPYNDPLVLAGQGTLGLEIAEQLPDLDTLFVSVGGGGLIAGISAWYQGRLKIVAVESEGTATYANALKHGLSAAIVPAGIAVSALGAASIGQNPWDILQTHPPMSMVVSDADIVAAQTRLWDVARLIGEPGAATALAPLTSGAYSPAPGERIGVVICGGNAQPDWFLQ